jgi:hypothetical protein
MMSIGRNYAELYFGTSCGRKTAGPAFSAAARRSARRNSPLTLYNGTGLIT